MHGGAVGEASHGVRQGPLKLQIDALIRLHREISLLATFGAVI